MEEAILRVDFPLGSLPARGWRCPVCGEETLLLADAGEVQRLAQRLGLFGVQGRKRRKLLKTGGSLAVTLDPELLREVLGKARAGTYVQVGREGGRIVITRDQGAEA